MADKRRTIFIGDGVPIEVPAGMSDEDVEARLKKSGIAFTGVELDQSTELAAMFGDRGFARDFGTLAGRAQTEEFEKLNPVEKVIVGFRGATRSITAGVSDLLGINQAGLEEFERLAGSDPNHLLDEVDGCDRLGDGMFDLEARVHLEEVQLASRRSPR